MTSYAERRPLSSNDVANSVQFYTNENVASVVVDGLRRRGVDVLTCQEAGMMGATDESHLTFSTEQSRVIFSQDDDFLRLHAKGVSYAGIVYAHQRTPVGVVIQSLLLIYQVLEPAEMANPVEFVP